VALAGRNVNDTGNLTVRRDPIQLAVIWPNGVQVYMITVTASRYHAVPGFVRFKVIGIGMRDRKSHHKRAQVSDQIDSHLFVRDWAGATACYNRALEIAPDSADARISLAYIEVFRNGNPTGSRKLLQNIPPGIDPDGIVTEAGWDLAMLERDYASAEKILTDSPFAGFPRAGEGAKAFFQGRTVLAHGDVESAQRYFAAAAPSFEGRMRDDPDNADRHAQLGLLYAYMRREKEALRESRRAVDLEPENRDAFHGVRASANLALVYALLGEPDQAITLIERLLSTPGPLDWPDFPQSITLADLRLRWEWDSLRSNPRFQKILAGPEPTTVY
jgi:tetratricopeptide (TPR) repeat protein